MFKVQTLSCSDSEPVLPATGYIHIDGVDLLDDALCLHMACWSWFCFLVLFWSRAASSNCVSNVPDAREHIIDLVSSGSGPHSRHA